MPVQINELIIRATITAPSEAPQGENQRGTSAEINKAEIVKECAQLVIEILNNKNSR